MALDLRVDDVGEKGLLERIRQRVVAQGVPESEGVLVGIGDDAALVAPPGRISGRPLIVTCDMLVEGVHFLRSRVDPFDLGHKALASSLSDIAASGGRALYALVSLAVPSGLEVDYIDRFWDGFLALASGFGVSLIGGDTSASPGPVVVDVTIIGEVLPGGPFLGSAMQPGDVICATGDFGAAAAGLELVLRDAAFEGDTSAAGLIMAEAAVRVRLAHFRPVPRLPEAAAAAAAVVRAAAGGLLLPPGRASWVACRDSSDGLGQAVNLMAAASGCGAELEATMIPISRETRHVAQVLGLDPLRLALYGGEDYELVMAVPQALYPHIRDAISRETGTQISQVGWAVPGSMVTLRLENGSVLPLEGGYEHFSQRRASELSPTEGQVSPKGRQVSHGEEQVSPGERQGSDV